MQNTLFNTPLLRPIAAGLCQLVLKMSGWRLEGRPPSVPKYVLIAVPHTSNWDFPLSLAIAFVYHLDLHWMGKDSLFKGWRGPIMRWLGGISINRDAAGNVVAQTIDAYNRSDHLVIAILPEGTRAKVDTWKTGFYYIALGAKIPIALAFMDYRRKAGGILSTFSPTGDVEKDIAEIRLRYAGISGRHTDKSTLG